MERVTNGAPALLLAAAAFSAIFLVAAAFPLGLFAALAVALSTLWLFRRRRGAPALFAAVFVLMSALTWASMPPKVQMFEAHSYRAVVEEIKTGARSQRGIAKVLAVDGDATDGFRVSFLVVDIVPQMRPGDIVAFNAVLQPSDRYADVPHMGASVLAGKADRVSAAVSLMPSDISVEGHSSALKYRFDDMRQAVADAVYASPLSADASRLLVASCLGTGDADVELKENFRSAGLSHLLCVSGFHVGIVAWLVLLVLLPMRLTRYGRVRYALVAVAVWLYAFMVGFGAPVVRAAIMLTVYCLSRMLQRGRSPFNALCVAFCVVLLVEPMWMFSAGFQLSFSAVAALLVFAGSLNPVPKRHAKLRSAASLLVVPLAVVLGSAPVMLVWFHRLPVLTMPANAVASLLFPVFMAGGAFAVALSHTGLASWPCSLVDGLHTFMCRIFDRFGEMSDAVSPYISLGAVSLVALAVAVVSLAIFVNIGKGRARIYFATLAASALLCVGCEPTAKISPCVVIDSSAGATSVWVLSDGVPYVFALEGRAEASSMAKRFFAAQGFSPDNIRCLTGGKSLELSGQKLCFVDKTTACDGVGDCDVLVVGRSFGGDMDALLACARPKRVLFSAGLSDKRRKACTASCARAGIPCQSLAEKAVCLQ